MAPARYRDALDNGTLLKRAEETIRLLGACRICPRQCGVNRLKGETGFCRTGRHAVVCSAFSHLGEEPAISGTCGSGAIFFTHCNMRCVYCQNCRFSQEGEGRVLTARELADTMLRLQGNGCHNINVITPTHVMPQILEALALAAQEGLVLPLVYNTSGYETVEALRLLDGIVDVYLPDMRYADEEPAVRYSSAPDYPRANQEAVREMFRQHSLAVFDGQGVMTQGLIIRHLVLPNGLAGTDATFAFIAKELSAEVFISLMSQYFPAYEACSHPALARRITAEEYAAAVSLLEKHGLVKGWVQEARGLQRFAGIHIKRNL